MRLQIHLPSFFNEERAESADVACTKHNSVEKSDKGGVDVILWKECAKLFRALGFWCPRLVPTQLSPKRTVLQTAAFADSRQRHIPRVVSVLAGELTFGRGGWIGTNNGGFGDRCLAD